jgi:predicted alternative tryptophan synthase beta-subunit
MITSNYRIIICLSFYLTNMTFHIDTPLVESTELPKSLPQHKDATILLKMDALQPSGSFKIRYESHSNRDDLII